VREDDTGRGAGAHGEQDEVGPVRGRLCYGEAPVSALAYAEADELGEQPKPERTRFRTRVDVHAPGLEAAEIVLNRAWLEVESMQLAGDRSRRYGYTIRATLRS